MLMYSKADNLLINPKNRKTFIFVGLTFFLSYLFMIECSGELDA